MKYGISLIVIFICIKSEANCKEWFNKLKIKPNEQECVSLCTTGGVDMSTFNCTSECDKLCQGKEKKKDFNVLLGSTYPGLNEAEKALIGKYPIEALQVAKSKFKAESLSEEVINSGSIDGENDAARHFFWAAFISNELGIDLATEFLDAHEKTKSQKADSRAMDLANNREGLLAYKRLKEKENFSEENLVIEFKKRFNGGNLSILKSTHKGNL